MKIYRLFVFCLAVLALAGCATATAPAEEGWISPLPTAVKGYELYSWRPDGVGSWHFALVTGTNRLKTYQEITAAADSEGADDWVKLTAVGLDEVKTLLRRLPARATVTWRSEGWLAGTPPAVGAIALPPARMVTEVEAHCRHFGIQLAIVDRPPAEPQAVSTHE